MKARICFLLMLIVVGCKDPFNPPVSSDKVGYLSVDGNINVTTKTATVKLTRAAPLYSSDLYTYVEDANVSIEDDNGVVYVIPYDSNGFYKRTGVDFDLTKNYRLRIRQKDGTKYSSSFIQLEESPPIDTVWWEPTNDGVAIKLNAKGRETDPRYYFWKYTETWEYHSSIPSYLDIVNDVVTTRPADKQIFICWGTRYSTQILIKSTDGLSQNIVDGFQVNLLPIGTPKLLQKYSILVEQYSLTKEAYNFQSELYKTTQNLGGLFDPLPFKVLGNITNDDDPEESVLGFFFGGTVTSKRIFIQYSELPSYLQVNGSPALDCKVVAIPVASISDRDKSLVIFGSYGVPVTQGYLFGSHECVDCTFNGGTNVQPSFWK
jgi:hypothetical protein